MENKGLCSTCVNDKECTFSREFPVWECEEFTDKTHENKKVRKNKK